MNISTTSRRMVNAREREQEALNLRRAGASYAKIAEVLGISAPASYKAVTRALARIAKTTNEQAEQVLAIELQRLDVATLHVMARVNKGDEKAIETLLKIQARRAKFLGLDAPEKHEHSGTVGTPSTYAEWVAMHEEQKNVKS